MEVESNAIMQALTIFTLRMIVPSARRKEVINSFAALLEPTRVQPGCLSCRLYSDFDDEDAIMLKGEWSSLAELERYLDSDACKTLVAAMDLSTDAPQIQIDTIVRKTGPALVAGLFRTDRLQ